MSIQSAVYDKLAASPELSELLAISTINGTSPAIYEVWADNSAEMPYINLSYTTNAANHWGKRETILNVDIFSNQDSTQAEAIKNRVIKILDRQKIELENNNYAQAHSNSDALIQDPEPSVQHWNIEFSIFYWRKNWFPIIEEPTEEPTTELTEEPTTEETTTEETTTVTTETTTVEPTTETTTETTVEPTIQEHANIIVVTQYDTSPFVLETSEFLTQLGNEVTIGSYVDFMNDRLDLSQYDLSAFLLYPNLIDVYDKITETEKSGMPVMIGYSSPMTGYLPYVGATEDIAAGSYSSSVIVDNTHYITSIYEENDSEIFKDEGTAIYQYPAPANYVGDSLVQDSEGNKIVTALDENTTLLDGSTTTSKILAYGFLTQNYKEAEKQLLQRSIQWLIT